MSTSASTLSNGSVMAARITVNVVREPKANQEPILSSGSVVWRIKLENIVLRSP